VSDLEDLEQVVATEAWGEWGLPVRVRVDHSPLRVFAKAVRCDAAVVHSDRAAGAAGFAAPPATPTFTFAMTHGGADPDLQPPAGTGSLWSTDATGNDGAAAFTARKGLFLHGEQHFRYHRTPVVGDVLEGRMRTSAPTTRHSRRGPMEVTYFQTRWSDTATGAAVVDELIVSLFLPDPA